MLMWDDLKFILNVAVHVERIWLLLFTKQSLARSYQIVNAHITKPAGSREMGRNIVMTKII
jgi:hypothetical protein